MSRYWTLATLLAISSLGLTFGTDVEIDEKFDLMAECDPLINFLTESGLEILLWPAHPRINLNSLKTKRGLTLLHCLSPTAAALSDSRKNIFNRLLLNGCEVAALDSLRRTPLHYAANCGNMEIAHLLMERMTREEIDTLDFKNRNAMYAAILRKNEAVATHILRKGGNVNVLDEWSNKALHLAAKKGSADMVEAILEKHEGSLEEKNLRGFTPMQIALQAANYPVVEIFLKKGLVLPDTDVRNLTFTKVTKHNCVKLLKYVMKNQGLHLLNQKDSLHEQTAAHYAAFNGHYDVLEMLLEAGANPSSKDKYDRTPLHLATINGHASIVRLLLHNEHVNTEVRDSLGKTPLYIAVTRTHWETMVALVEAGANVNAIDLQLQTPMHYAALGGKVEFVRYLKEHGSDLHSLDHRYNTCLHLSVVGKNVEMTRFMLDAGVQVGAVDAYGRTALHLAAQCPPIIDEIRDKNKGSKYSYEILEMILEDSGLKMIDRPDNRGRTPLLLAVKHGHVGIARFLIQKGSNKNAVDIFGETALHLAIRHPFQAMAIFLIKEARVEIQVPSYAQRRFPIHVAVKNWTPEILNILVEAGCDYNCKDKYGQTPLHIAAREGAPNVVKALLKLPDIDINPVDDHGRSPLHMAAQGGNLAACRLLIQKLVDTGNGFLVNYMDNVRRTPLLIAVTMNRPDIGALILKTGYVVVNLQDSHGRTCMHAAVAKSGPEFVDLLLRYEFDINATDKHSLTPLDVAYSYRDSFFQDFLMFRDAISHVNPNLRPSEYDVV